MRRTSLIVFGAFALAGCRGPRPALVYVDLDRLSAGQTKPNPIQIPAPSAPAPARTVTLPALPATTTTDRLIQRLQQAKELIAASRHQSIESLNDLLKSVYLAEAEAEIARNAHSTQPDRAGIFAGALAELRAVFLDYGQERGPLLAQLSIYARNTDLAPALAPSDATPIEAYNTRKSNLVREQIREMDARYQARADQLLADAQKEIDAQLRILQGQAERERADAERKAKEEAKRQLSETQVDVDNAVESLIPPSLPAVPAESLTVPAGPGLGAAPTFAPTPLFGSLEQRRRILDQQVDLWIKSKGWRRASKPVGARNATDEFLQWRHARNLGP